MSNIFVVLKTTKKILLLVLVISTCSFFAQTRTQKIKLYIQQHKELAIEQMVKFKIPASVILAQAIKESDFGCSTLAKATNNHFGIKCHNEWGGNSYTFDDDSLNECFRSYNSVEDSFLDHSMFLISRPRYAELFKLSITDHYNWCIGLKKAGYATAWSYTDELLLIIAVHHLSDLDRAEPLATRVVIKPLNVNEKDIVYTSQNYFTSAEKAILAKVIFNQMPAVEEPLLVLRDDSDKHAE